MNYHEIETSHSFKTPLDSKIHRVNSALYFIESNYTEHSKLTYFIIDFLSQII